MLNPETFNEILQFKDETLRPYQQDKKEKIYKAWQEKKAVMLQMPTGTGKTRLFSSIISDFHSYSIFKHRAVKVLVLVHRKELLEQIKESLSKNYQLASGIIQSQTAEKPNIPIQIATVQTLVNRLGRWQAKDFDVIIVDEAHHILAKSYQDIIETFPDAKLLGVTATPYRLSGEGFTDTFEVLVLSEPIKQFIRQGYLSSLNYYSVPSLSSVCEEIKGLTQTSSDGDYDQNELLRICNTGKIRSQIVSTYLDIAKGKKGIVYTINVRHNNDICSAFQEAGVNAVSLDSLTDKADREEAIDKFRKGEIDVICNVNLFSEGLDCPDIAFVQLCRPTKSLALYLQQVGRGLRPHKDKQHCIVIDNVGLYQSFGLPDSNRKWQYHFEGTPKGQPKIIDRGERAYHRNQDTTEGFESVCMIHSSDEEYERLKKLYCSIIESIHNILAERVRNNGFGLNHPESQAYFPKRSLFFPLIEREQDDTDGQDGQGGLAHLCDTIFSEDREKPIMLYTYENQVKDYLGFEFDKGLSNSYLSPKYNGKKSLDSRYDSEIVELFEGFNRKKLIDFVSFIEDEFGESAGTYFAMRYLNSETAKTSFQPGKFFNFVFYCELRYYSTYASYDRLVMNQNITPSQLIAKFDIDYIHEYLDVRNEQFQMSYSPSSADVDIDELQKRFNYNDELILKSVEDGCIEWYSEIWHGGYEIIKEKTQELSETIRSLCFSYYEFCTPELQHLLKSQCKNVDCDDEIFKVLLINYRRNGLPYLDVMKAFGNFKYTEQFTAYNYWVFLQCQMCDLYQDTEYSGKPFWIYEQIFDLYQCPECINSCRRRQ